jgi:hypothetical protein
MEIIRRNESSLHRVPNAVPLLCVLDMLVCIISAITLLIPGLQYLTGNHAALSGPGKYVAFAALGIGLFFSFFADNYYDWMNGYAYEPEKGCVSYSLCGSLAPTDRKTTVKFLSVKSVEEKGGRVVVKGDIEKQVPRRQVKHLSRYVVPKGFSGEQRDRIVKSLEGR